MSDPRFVHLRVHSDYSMIDGLAKINLLVKKAAEFNMPALALTDFNNLCGLIKFYEETQNAGIKPIIGADFQIQSKLSNNEMMQLTILAMNKNIGYQNLILLISRAYQRGYGKSGPWINYEWLSELNNGLLIISGGRMGDIGRGLLRGTETIVNQYIKFYKRYFPDRFYLELIRTGRPDEEDYLASALSLAEKNNLPVVATNDVRFISNDDFDAHEVRVAIHDGFILDDPNRPRKYSPQQYMRSENEMCELFADIPEALKNSIEIAKRCNVLLDFDGCFLPQFPTGNMTAEELLIMKSKLGLEERLLFIFPNIEERQRNRLNYDKRLDMELQIINQMGFPSYFLIVMEFVKWSKDNGIPVGPGRGSGAGSLVAYALKITELDPIKLDLLFERFLNPERISMPDFDIDFCMETRDKVIEHIADMYGQDAVSQIITFGTMTAKAVIRDVGRTFGYSYNFVNRISKLIPSDPGMTLARAFEVESQLSKLYEVDEEVKVLIDMARKLEGVIRNASKHAGGLVISPTKITDFVPVYCDELGQHPLTQFDKDDIEYIGLVKFDFLGLRTLTIINLTLKMINNRRKKNNEACLDISNIPLNDEKSFKLLQSSETTAIFQLESYGMKDLIKRLQPDCFEDIIALIALFRPGPLNSGMVDNFINRKHGLEEISYPDTQWQHENLKSVLEPTYGIILYQEQVMQIAQVLSGYTLGRADILRRAMSKKQQAEMTKQRLLFKEGANKKGINSKLAMKIFNLVEKFAGYGFNKSHSAAYALISYQTLWLKANYPAEFMAAVMTADMDNINKMVGLVDECWRMGLKILPPEINSCLYHFHVNENGEIVYGIGAIKGIGAIPAKIIVETRNKGGQFYDLFEFCARINIRKVNRKIIEKLIMSGAFDKLGSHRTIMMNSLDDAIKAAYQQNKNEMIGQSDMFDNHLSKQLLKDKQIYNKCDELWSDQILLNGEREALGLYITGHPINQYLKEINCYTGGYRIKDMFLEAQNKIITVAGLVINLKFTNNKNGDRIAIFTLDDRSSHLEVILFNEFLNKFQNFLKKDTIIIVKGKISFNNFNNKPKMFAYEIMDIIKAREKYIQGLTLLLVDKQINIQFLNQLRKFLEPYCQGNVPVYLYYQRVDACARLRLGPTWHILLSDHLLNNLRNFIGSEQVILEFNWHKNIGII